MFFCLNGCNLLLVLLLLQHPNCYIPVDTDTTAQAVYMINYLRTSNARTRTCHLPLHE
jgi:hypothetical protein